MIVQLKLPISSKKVQQKKTDKSILSPYPAQLHEVLGPLHMSPVDRAGPVSEISPYL